MNIEAHHGLTVDCEDARVSSNNIRNGRRGTKIGQTSLDCLAHSISELFGNSVAPFAKIAQRLRLKSDLHLPAMGEVITGPTQQSPLATILC